MRVSAEQKNEKAIELYKVLLKLKEKCDNGDFCRNKETIRIFLYNNGFSNSGYFTAMNKLKIIYKDNFLCNRWKENIPVTKKLALTIINKNSELYIETIKLRKQRYRNEKQTQVKTPITDKRINNGGKRVNSGRKSKKVELQKHLENNIQKVGIIRRFLKWIY